MMGVTDEGAMMGESTLSALEVAEKLDGLHQTYTMLTFPELSRLSAGQHWTPPEYFREVADAAGQKPTLVVEVQAYKVQGTFYHPDLHQPMATVAVLWKPIVEPVEANGEAEI